MDGEDDPQGYKVVVNIRGDAGNRYIRHSNPLVEPMTFPFALPHGEVTYDPDRPLQRGVNPAGGTKRKKASIREQRVYYFFFRVDHNNVRLMMKSLTQEQIIAAWVEVEDSRYV